MTLAEFASPDVYVVYALLQAAAFLLLVRFSDLYEREPLFAVFALFAWGATVAVLLARAGNEAFRGLFGGDVDDVFGPAIAAPPVEELAKGLALAAAFVISRKLAPYVGLREFDGVTDGVVYGAAVGLGFAFAEDLSYLFDHSVAGGFEAYRDRVDPFGATMLGHAVYSATFGAALGAASWVRRHLLAALLPPLGLALAILMHAFHNGAVQVVMVSRYGLDDYLQFEEQRRGEFDVSRGAPLDDAKVEGMESTRESVATVVDRLDQLLILGFVVAIALWLRYQRRVIREELEGEARAGLIEPGRPVYLSQYWRRSLRYWQLLLLVDPVRWQVTRQLDHNLVELALLKRRSRRMGREARSLPRCRRRIRQLRQAELALADRAG